MTDHQIANADALVPDPEVAREFNVTLMTLWRWSHDPALLFPPAIKIKTRNYRSRRALNAFRDKIFRAALAERGAA